MDEAPSQPAPKLLDQVRRALRMRHRSPRTEEAYIQWIRRYIRFHGQRHPRDLGRDELTRFISSLAVERNVSASTQTQALSALVFLYKHVLLLPFDWLDDITRARKPKRLPVVLSRREVAAILEQLGGTYWLIASLLYGSGLRLLEACQLRIKDVDLDRRELSMRSHHALGGAQLVIHQKRECVVGIVDRTHAVWTKWTVALARSPARARNPRASRSPRRHALRFRPPPQLHIMG